MNADRTSKRQKDRSGNCRNQAGAPTGKRCERIIRNPGGSPEIARERRRRHAEVWDGREPRKADGFRPVPRDRTGRTTDRDVARRVATPTPRPGPPKIAPLMTGVCVLVLCHLLPIYGARGVFMLIIVFDYRKKLIYVFEMITTRINKFLSTFYKQVHAIKKKFWVLGIEEKIKDYLTF